MQSIARVQETQEPVKVLETSRKRSFLRDEFPFIHRASIIFAFCVTIGIILITGTQFLLDGQLDAVQRAQAHERAARTSFEKVANEKQEVQTFQPKYEQLVAQGFIGAEKRLDWIETIQAIQRRAALMPINYEISEQQPFVVDPAIDLGSLELNGSKMSMKMDLLHEGDMQYFFDSLMAKHVVDLQSCKITRLLVTESVSVVPRLSAECTLYWITIGRRAEAAGTPNPSTPTGN